MIVMVTLMVMMVAAYHPWMTWIFPQSDSLRAAPEDSPLQEEVHNLVERAPPQDPGRAGGVEGGAAQQEAEEDPRADPRLWQLHEQGPEGQRARLQVELVDPDRGHEVELQQEHDSPPLHGRHL